MRRRYLGMVFAGGLALVSGPAHADVISPEQDACQGKAADAACTVDGRAGTCKADECCRNDYSNGTPPTTVCGPCNTCQPGAAAADKEESKGCAASAGDGLAPGALLAGLLLAAGLWRSRRRG